MAASPILKPTSRRPAQSQSAATKPKLGLRAWMERVLEECDRAAAGFDVEAVHDLRVALRRCRSLADGLMALDPEGSWKEMKKAGKKLFQALGDLRDMQVMEEWIEKLDGNLRARASHDGASERSSGDGSFSVPPSEGHSSDDPLSGHAAGDPVAIKLLDHLHARETELKQLAVKDLDSFDRRQWRKWSRELPSRAARVRPGSIVYLHLALEKWTAAYDLHKQALRTRSRVGLHQLRIGIKRFRYTVENFLPRQHAAWGADLKELQDLLGEVHDLDVLWATALEIGAFPDLESRRRWRKKLDVAREKRIARYREKMVGQSSLWRVWRAELPDGPQLRAAAMSRIRVWAGYLDPDFAHSERVSRLALTLYDGLRASGLVPSYSSLPQLTVASTRLSFDDARKSLYARGRAGTRGKARVSRPDLVDASAWGLRAVLQAAAFMHDVGKARGAEKHWKTSYRMIRAMGVPFGWNVRELELAAVVARYHRGALPSMRTRTLQVLELPDRRIAMELAGILRLANTLDLGPRPHENGNESRLEVALQGDFVVVRVTGYSPSERPAEEIAGARHLLETVLGRPVLVRGLRAASGKFVAPVLRVPK